MEPQGKVLLAGAAGLTGRACFNLLLKDESYPQVEIWVRKPTGIHHPKLTETLIDFDQLKHIPATDAAMIFCCLGTTMKKAGSREAFRKVDFEYVTELARLGEFSGIDKFIVISSMGANKGSSNFYLRVKGEMEEVLAGLSIPTTYILRPSMLLGIRNEVRLGESAGKSVMKALKPLFMGKIRKFRPIEAEDVAKTMIKLGMEEGKGLFILESDRIQEIADQKK